MSEEFEDIEIVDLDVAKTTWSRVHSSMRTVYLKLSREPDTMWTRRFLEERARRINPKRHGLWIEDAYIVIDCFVNEVESHHLPDVRLSLAHANRIAREAIGQRRDLAEQSRVDNRTEREELAALRARIRGTAPRQDVVFEVPAEQPYAFAPAARVNAPNPVEPDFATKRSDWQARFRAALAFRKKEPARDDD
jgi:hypothetical protein